MAAPSESLPTTIGVAVCTSWFGRLFPAACAAGAAVDYAAARADGSIITAIGDESESVIRAAGEPLANAADIARWTTIGIIVIVAFLALLIGLGLFFYFRGFGDFGRAA